MNPGSPRPLSDFSVEIEVYSGPYEWLLALILHQEIDVFEVPLRDLVSLYLRERISEGERALERDAEFAGSAAALVLLKSNSLFPALEEPAGDAGEEVSAEDLAQRLSTYLRVKRGAEYLRGRFERGWGYHPTGHALEPRRGMLRIDRRRLEVSARRVFSRLEEPSLAHIDRITLSLRDLVSLIRDALLKGGGPLSYEELVRDMDRVGRALAFAAAVSLASEGEVRLLQEEPFGPLRVMPA
ncbi:segregation and condensation protein A [Rubrobacter calidifluminis]|uniref:segregation and condensation protein A n=1 Tax=Rubrobacter calidifluminis TaxID=1392640 RepID=UPI00235ECF4A|nr:segregation/condensation protein A [Rubrobacter calidifluminis]